MAQRVGKLAAGSVIAHLEARLKLYTKETIPATLWMEMLNSKCQFMFEATGTLSKSIYKDSAVISDIATAKGGIVPTGQGCYYTQATRRLYIPNAAFTNYFSTAIANATAIPEGSAVLLVDNSDRANNIYLKTFVESIAGANEVVLKDAYGANIPQDRTMFAISIPTQAETIQLSALSIYKDIAEITTIFSTAINDECVEAQDLTNFYTLRSTSMGYNYRNQIIWAREGEILRLAKGVDVSSYGELTMHYVRYPYNVAKESDIVDIPQSNLDVFYRLMILEAMQVLNVPIPEALIRAVPEMNMMVQGKDKRRMERQTNVNDQ